jgi:protein TonB
VNTNGIVEDVTLIKGLDPVLDNEAIQVIKSCPQWNPGKQHGKPVKVSYKLPLVFTM